MTCKVCNKNYNSTGSEDCFEEALDVIKLHFFYYKNNLQQRDLELQHIKERNEKLGKALNLLQKNQHSSKRFKKHHNNDSCLSTNFSQDDCNGSELSLTDDEAISASKLNVALHSEQLFDSLASSQSKNDISMISSSEMLKSPRIKESPKRNKQYDTNRTVKDINKNILRTKSEWRTKRNSPIENSWATNLLQPTTRKVFDEPLVKEGKKFSLSIKRTNPSKIKQSLICFNKTKDETFRESDAEEDIVGASPLIIAKNPKVERSLSHRTANNYNTSGNHVTNASLQIGDNKTIDDIVFDFSPSKKTDSPEHENSSGHVGSKKLEDLNGAIAKDCIFADNIGFSTNKSDSSSVVVLTPSSEDIIFVDDSCVSEPEIETMDILNDNFEKLKKVESKCIQKHQQSKEVNIFKKPSNIRQTNDTINIKQEKTSQDHLLEQKQVKEIKVVGTPSCSRSSSHRKHKNPLLSMATHSTEDDEDCMPKPFLVKQEIANSKTLQKSIKERFNVDCEDCEKLINFLNGRVTDEEIQQHLDKCKRHNKTDIMRQNTPNDFWNPFILSFQAGDPRNEILIDNRFKDMKQ